MNILDILQKQFIGDFIIIIAIIKFLKDEDFK